MGTTKDQLALIKKDVVDIVVGRVREMTTANQLHLPTDYSWENAMKSAWLKLQTTVDKHDKPVLDVCTPDSIANSLLDMIIQGLTPYKEQCYFIAYGPVLSCRRSYFGSMALVRRILPGCEIWYEVAWKGDKLTYSIERGRKVITDHEQDVGNIGGEIDAAYCVIEEPGTDIDGVMTPGEIHTTLMVFSEIEQAWKQSPLYPKKDGTHEKFPGEMALRTVINRGCKKIINTSGDAHLLAAIHASDEFAVEAEVEEEIAENANADVIDVDPPEDNDQVESDQVEADDAAEEGANKAETEPEPVAAAGGKAPF